MIARVVAVLVAVVGAVPAVAAPIYATGFENPPFANGSQLFGQDGWTSATTGALAGLLSPNAATISTALPASGLQGVRVRGSDLVPQAALAAFGYEAVGSYRRPVNFDAVAAGLPVVRVQAALRLDGPLTAQTADRVTGDFSSVNLGLVTADGEADLSISSDGHAYGFDPNGDYLFGVPVSLGQYHDLAIEANFSRNVFDFYLDGGRIGTRPFAFTSGVVNRGSLVFFANLPGTVPGVARADYTAYADNFSITAVPEPATVAVIGLFGLGAAVARRRRVMAV